MLRSLELANFGRYDAIKVDFKPGMNAIVGPNGAGKSTLLMAVAGVMSGKFDAFPGNKVDNIRCNTTEKDKAWAKVVMALKGGQDVEITRSIRPSGQKLKVGKQTYTKLDEIQREIGRWLGMDPRTFIEFAFAFQWELRRITDDSPTERAHALHRLFRLDHIEKCHDVISHRLNTLEQPVVAVDIASAQAQLDTTQQRIKDIDKQLTELTPYPKEVIAQVRDDLKRAERRKVLVASIAARTSERLSENDELVIADRQLRHIVDTVIPSLDELLAKLDALDISANLQIWKQRKDILAKRQEDVNKYEQLKKCVAGKESAWQWTHTAEARMKSLEAELSRLKKFLDTFNPKTGIACCPTCYNPAAQIAQRYWEYNSKYIDNCSELSDLRERQQKAQETEKLVSACLRLEERIALWDKSIAPPPVHSEEQLIADESQRAGLVFERNKARGKETLLRSNIAHRSATIAQIDKQLTLEITERDSIPDDPAVAENALLILQEHEHITLETNRLKGQREILQESVVYLEKSIKEAEKSRDLIAQMSTWRLRLGTIRDAFHRDQLPQAIAQKRLEKLEGGVNEYLDELGVDFRISVGSNLSFTARFPDGRVVPAERLSGGEKVVFALAWRLVVNSTFAGDVGLLCLDEPTAGLDGDRLECLRRALKRLRLLAGSHGLQCVIVTHERTLLPIFDHFIELK